MNEAYREAITKLMEAIDTLDGMCNPDECSTCPMKTLSGSCGIPSVDDVVGVIHILAERGEDWE